MTSRTSHLQPWSVSAVNLPEHSDNAVHTDQGAQAAGFPRAIVAGTTVYAYLTHPFAEAWGRQWIENGGAEVRFRSPVFDRDVVDCVPTGDDTIEARVSGSPTATMHGLSDATEFPVLGAERLPPLSLDLRGDLASYGERAGDDLTVYDDLGTAHPVLWPTIANRVMIAHLVTGPWIHVRSRIAHLGHARVGATALVESAVVDRFQSRAGERVIIDVRVSIDERPVAAIEHESVVEIAESGATSGRPAN
jgi:hypothetical protein